jgi:AcrR family transcriptional regulator
VQTTSTRSRAGNHKSAARRQEIVWAAVEVFSASGFYKGSLRDVAERVGMSQAGILHHFSSKNDLLAAVLAWRDDETRRRLGPTSGEGVDVLRFAVKLAEYNATTPELVELHVILSAEATSPDHPVHDYFKRRYVTIREEACAAFQHAADRGYLKRGVHGSSAARSLVALMDGLQVQWLLAPTAVDMAGELRRFLEPLLTVEL